MPPDFKLSSKSSFFFDVSSSVPFLYHLECGRRSQEDQTSRLLLAFLGLRIPLFLFLGCCFLSLLCSGCLSCLPVVLSLPRLIPFTNRTVAPERNLTGTTRSSTVSEMALFVTRCVIRFMTSRAMVLGKVSHTANHSV